MKKFLEKRLKIYEHEFGRFMWITAVFFAINFVAAIFRNYVDTSFLKRFGVDYIPLMLVINGLLTFVIFGVFNRLGRKYQDHALLS
ncbi:MAG: hypothetical protein AB1896_23125, partial [Thermodesulfobacteriota bacterium]